MAAELEVEIKGNKKREVSERVAGLRCFVVLLIAAFLCSLPWTIGIAQNRLNYLRWSSNGIQNYKIRVEFYSTSDDKENVLVTVQNGFVTKVTGSSDPLSQPKEFQGLAIEELFRASLNCMTFLCEVHYDTTYGFPTFMTQRLLEFGTTVTVSDFQKLP